MIGRVIVVCLALLLGSCARSETPQGGTETSSGAAPASGSETASAPTVGTAPPTAESGAGAEPEAEPGAGSEAGPPLPGLILWLEELPGYVPADVAEIAHRYSLRFGLHEDGTLLYRDDRYQHYRVRLDPEEVQTLVDSVIATGFLELEPIFEGPDQLVIMDSGSETVGMRWGKRVRIVNLPGGARFLEMQFPDNAGVRTAKSVRDRLIEYQHPDAQPCER